MTTPILKEGRSTWCTWLQLEKIINDQESMHATRWQPNVAMISIGINSSDNSYFVRCDSKGDHCLCSVHKDKKNWSVPITFLVADQEVIMKYVLKS